MPAVQYCCACCVAFTQWLFNARHRVSFKKLPTATMALASCNGDHRRYQLPEDRFTTMLTFEVTHGKAKTTITLSDDATIGDLRSALEQWSKVPSSAQKLSGPLGVNKTLSARLVECGAKAEERVRALAQLCSLCLLCRTSPFPPHSHHTHTATLAVVSQQMCSILV